MDRRAECLSELEDCASEKIELQARTREAVIRAARAGCTVTVIAATLGVSRPTVYAWLRE